MFRAENSFLVSLFKEKFNFNAREIKRNTNEFMPDSICLKMTGCLFNSSALVYWTGKQTTFL
jgi:hypothetical protein